MVYQFKWRATHYKIPAQEAGEYLERMSEEENGITPARVLEVSRSEDALLHPCFEWDDTKAAEAHRLNQARLLIGNLIRVTVKESEDEDISIEPQRIRAFVNVSNEAHAERGRFKPIITALSEGGSRRMVLENARRDALLFREKYARMEEFSEVLKAIDHGLQTTA